MEALRRELRNLARKNTENDSMVDYYRDLSALSNKLYETQSIHDTVMEDPMGLFNPVGDDEIVCFFGLKILVLEFNHQQSPHGSTPSRITQPRPQEHRE